MFITRATRHDKSDAQEFYKAHDWNDADVDEGTVFIARDGGIVGAMRLIELAPGLVMVEDVLVKEDRRGSGIGEALMKAAMNSRGGKLFLSTHKPTISFYERLGFRLVDPDDCPVEAVDYWKQHGEIPWTPDHVHYFMTAR
jgi:GNAT superfamily N-acetyltransferase